MNKPVLISAAAILAAGVVAAILWQTPRDHADHDAEPDLDPVAKEQPVPALPHNDPPGSIADPEQYAGVQPAPSGTPDLAQQEQESPEALAKIRQALEQQHDGLGKALNLTPAEVDRVLDMLVRFQRESLTGSSNRQNQEAELQALLGNKYAQWEEYSLAPETRQTVENLQILFEISDIKLLTGTQAATLAAALTAEQLRINHEMSSVMLPSRGRDLAAKAREELEWEVRYTPDTNRRLALAASRHLDAQQLAVYTRMLEDGHNRQIALMRANLARQEASGQPAGSVISH